MTWDTRRENVGGEEFVAADDAEVAAGGRGDGGTEFKSGAMVAQTAGLVGSSQRD